MNYYALCGLKVASVLPLPDLVPWAGDGRQADLSIRLDDVPELENPHTSRPLLQIADDGTCRFEMKAVAAYRVDPEGREIVIEPHMPADAPDIRVFLFGTVFAIVCFRRGLLPLHASVVRIGDKAVAFSGVSGAGKSTLAAMFLKRGYSILADDVAVTEVRDGTVMVQPAFPRLKLWRDAMDGLAFETEGLERARAQLEKFHMPVEAFAGEPLPLASVYYLEEAVDPRHEEMRTLLGIDAFRYMKTAVYRSKLGYNLLGSGPLFAMAGRVVGGVRSVILRRIRTLARAEEIVDLIARHETAG
jgi:hypothetical protein